MMKLHQQRGVGAVAVAAADVMVLLHGQAQGADDPKQADAKPMTAVTRPGDYKGDCFRLVAKPDATSGLKEKEPGALARQA